MTAPIVFLDTETTGLDLDDDIWEIVAIRREPGRATDIWHWFITHDLAKSARLPDTFRADHDNRYRPGDALRTAELADLLVKVVFAVPDGTPYDLRPHVVGAVPSFDTTRLELLLRRHGYLRPPWHHHIQDAETLAIGWLHGARAALLDEGYASNRAPSAPPGPPWHSEDLSRAIGVDPDQYEQHTAMGDVRWAMAIWDRVMNGCEP